MDWNGRCFERINSWAGDAENLDGALDRADSYSDDAQDMEDWDVYALFWEKADWEIAAVTEKSCIFDDIWLRMSWKYVYKSIVLKFNAEYDWKMG